MNYNVTRPELVWPGKYDENGKRSTVDRVTLPFQVIERVNESRATRETEKARGLTLFDVWRGDKGETFDEGWRNKLIWGDNRLVMSSLLDQFAGKVDLIYIDPPFATGADFSFTAEVGDSGNEIYKEQSLIAEKAYRDTWGEGLGSYLTNIAVCVSQMRELLSETGSIYVHLDWHVGHHVKLILDEVFGRGNYINECIWYYKTGGMPEKLGFGRKHDTLHFYAKNREQTYWQPQKEKSYLSHKYGFSNVEIFQDKDGSYTLVNLRDVWDIAALRGNQPEKLPYPTQKPEALLERVITASCPPGGLVADFFIGSGTAAAVAEKLGKRWIGCDLSRYAIHVTRKRMLEIDGCQPFEILNLGKYERRYWQVATFGEDLDQDRVITLYEYAAFILKLYGANPAAGMQYLHGKLGRAFVHVGAVDSPVTIDEIASSVNECIALRAQELHILGWEWEMGLHDLMTEEARARGIRLILRQIPREVMEQQAVDAGDVQFFELAYLDLEVIPTNGRREVVAELKNFVMPNPELVPDQVREKITMWSDYVDYWAVDWDFSEDAFMQGWVTYRTRQDRSLDLRSDPHTYGEPGEYAVMAKVIDIFGNDTSKIVRVKVG
jgi:adenine-specific DNA-methyltransferase